MTHENEHRAHPVRNFFYTLYSLLNILAFVGFFYALADEALSFRLAVLVLTGALLALALFVGVFRPVLRARRGR